MSEVDASLRGVLHEPGDPAALARAALIIAQLEYPQLDVEAYLGWVTLTGDRLRQRLAADASRAHRLTLLNHMLYTELGYRGAEQNYYDPRNSFLNEVIDRRVGIPITLSILHMALAQRVGLPVAGVCFPGHFLVRCAVDGGVAIIDPYQRGICLSEQDLRARLGGAVAGDDETLARYLRPAGMQETLLRLLRNLKAIYLDSKQPAKALGVLDCMLILAPDSALDLRDRGLIYRELECYRAAQEDLQRYCTLAPHAAADDAVQEALNELARRPLH